MVDGQNFVRSLLGDPAFKRTFYGAELGMPQAIYELAKTYIAMRNFTEAIAWSRTLAENPNLVEQAIELLSEIISYSTDPDVIEEAHKVISELNSQVAMNQSEQKNSLEKQSFLIATATIDDV
jgi:hypothetical protein